MKIPLFKSAIGHGSNELVKLILIATLVGGFLLFSANLFYDNDSILLMSYTRALSQGKSYLDSAAIVRYDIAYPLLLILSGYTLHHSLIGITLINTAMGILMPILIYFTVKPLFPRGAYYTALVVIFSLSPFFYIKFIRPDHAYMFFSMLSIYLLSRFIDTKRAIFLYSMTMSLIVASLLRSAGNILLPCFILMAFLFARGAWKHCIICALMGALVFSVYLHHRHDFFSKYGQIASFNGRQTFQNLHVNSREYHILLSEELGPAMKAITDNLYQAVLPSPATSSFITSHGNPVESYDRYVSDSDFLNAHVYPFSAKELTYQVYKHPCWDYNYMLYIASPNDALFLKASFEIIRHYPWYPIRYTARNMWYMLYDPGYEHSRYTLGRFSRTVIREAYPFDASTGNNANLSDRAMREISFDNFSNKFSFQKKIISHLKKIYCEHYLTATKLIFYFMAIAWLAVMMDLINQYTSVKKFQSIVDLLPPKLTPLTLILTSYLFISVLIIGFFVDPLLRYHNHLLPFKIMLAGLGVCTLCHVIYQVWHGNVRTASYGGAVSIFSLIR